MAMFGGDLNVTLPVVIANDTGSNVQTVFTSDLASLNYEPNTYRGLVEYAEHAMAGGNYTTGPKRAVFSVFEAFVSFALDSDPLRLAPEDALIFY
jgi:hypothetical protein